MLLKPTFSLNFNSFIFKFFLNPKRQRNIYSMLYFLGEKHSQRRRGKGSSDLFHPSHLDLWHSTVCNYCDAKRNSPSPCQPEGCSFSYPCKTFLARTASHTYCHVAGCFQLPQWWNSFFIHLQSWSYRNKGGAN